VGLAELAGLKTAEVPPVPPVAKGLICPQIFLGSPGLSAAVVAVVAVTGRMTRPGLPPLAALAAILAAGRVVPAVVAAALMARSILAVAVVVVAVEMALRAALIPAEREVWVAPVS
jgi:hypothetical protein